MLYDDDDDNDDDEEEEEDDDDNELCKYKAAWHFVRGCIHTCRLATQLFDDTHTVDYSSSKTVRRCTVTIYDSRQLTIMLRPTVLIYCIHDTSICCTDIDNETVYSTGNDLHKSLKVIGDGTIQ